MCPCWYKPCAHAHSSRHSRILIVFVLVWAPRDIGLHRLDRQCAHAWAFQPAHRMAMLSEDGAISWKPRGLAACCRLRLCRVRGPGPVSFAPANVPPKGGWLLFCVGPSSPTGGRLPRNPVPKASQTAGCQCCACIGGAGRVLRGGLCPEQVRGAVLCGTPGPSMQPNGRAPSRERNCLKVPRRRPRLWAVTTAPALGGRVLQWGLVLRTHAERPVLCCWAFLARPGRRAGAPSGYNAEP